jgi:hypothetical protein
MSRPAETSAASFTPQESSIIAVVGAIQFVNILDFMMVMPLGPDFATELGIPTSHLGRLAASTGERRLRSPWRGLSWAPSPVASRSG